MSEAIKVATITAGDEATPSTRVRILEIIKLVGSEFVFRMPGFQTGLFGKLLNRARVAKLIFWADVILIQKRPIPWVLVKLSLLLHRPIVFDFDDAIFTPQPGYHFSQKDLRRYRRIIKNAAVCVAGNAYLARWASTLNSNVKVIATGIDTVAWSPKARVRHEGVNLGWIGTEGNLQYLEKILPLVDRAIGDLRSARLIVVCSRPPRFELKYRWLEFRPWQLETELASIADVDIGLMPLENDAWSRGKCGFKALQFMSLGIPVVISPIGVNSQIVTMGTEGFLAESDEEWLQALESLLGSSKMREQMGKRARTRVVESFSNTTLAIHLSASLHSAVGKGCKQ